VVKSPNARPKYFPGQTHLKNLLREKWKHSILAVALSRSGVVTDFSITNSLNTYSEHYPVFVVVENCLAPVGPVRRMN
jgi:hypothetical protein